MTTSAVAYFVEANVVCFIMFGIMLMFDLSNMDRQRKQVMFDYVLVSYMLFLVADTLRIEVEFGALPASMFSVSATFIFEYVMDVVISYAWLRYALAAMNSRFGDRPRDRVFMLLPFVVATAVFAVIFCTDPSMIVNSDLKHQPLAVVLDGAVPFAYLFIILTYSLVRAYREKNTIERREILFVGVFPLIVIMGEMIELVSPTRPVYCFSCTVLVLAFYIRIMQSRISMDPLTGLNNRNQLARYISQDSNLYHDDCLTYVVMIDANDFKGVNDTYGHATGDEALVIIATALKHAAGSSGFPVFICRYGGDEFLLIAHPTCEDEVTLLAARIREQIAAICEDRQTPYLLSVGIGYDLLREGDSFQKSLKRADQRLYADKRASRLP